MGGSPGGCLMPGGERFIEAEPLEDSSRHEPLFRDHTPASLSLTWLQVLMSTPFRR